MNYIEQTDLIDDCLYEIRKYPYGKVGIVHYILYTMLNGDLQECYDRVMYWWRVNQRQRENHEPNVYIHA